MTALWAQFFFPGRVVSVRKMGRLLGKPAGVFRNPWEIVRQRWPAEELAPSVAFLQVSICDTKKHTDGMGLVVVSLDLQLSPSQASSLFHCPVSTVGPRRAQC
jgi:hypothetical protein